MIGQACRRSDSFCGHVGFGRYRDSFRRPPSVLAIWSVVFRTMRSFWSIFSNLAEDSDPTGRYFALLIPSGRFRVLSLVIGMIVFFVNHAKMRISILYVNARHESRKECFWSTSAQQERGTEETFPAHCFGDECALLNHLRRATRPPVSKCGEIQRVAF